MIVSAPAEVGALSLAIDRTRDTRAGSVAAAGGPGSWFLSKLCRPQQRRPESSRRRIKHRSHHCCLLPWKGTLQPDAHLAPDRPFFTVGKDRIAVPDRCSGCHNLGHHVAKDCLEGERIAVNEPGRQFLVLRVDVDPYRSAEICLELPGAPVNVPRRAFLRLPAKCRREWNKLDRKARARPYLKGRWALKGTYPSRQTSLPSRVDDPPRRPRRRDKGLARRTAS